MAYRILRTPTNPGTADWGDAASTLFTGGTLINAVDLDALTSVNLTLTVFGSFPGADYPVVCGWAPGAALPANVRLMVTGRVTGPNEVTVTVFNAGSANMGGAVTLTITAMVLNLAP